MNSFDESETIKRLSRIALFLLAAFLSTLVLLVASITTCWIPRFLEPSRRSIETLEGSGWTISRRSDGGLAALIYNPTLNQDQYRALARAKNLREIEFFYGLHPEADYRKVFALRNLQDSLRSVTTPNLTDFTILAPLHNLEEIRLSIYDPSVAGGLGALACLPKLRQVALWGCDGAVDVSSLNRQASLEGVEIAGRQSNISGLEALSDRIKVKIITEESLRKLLRAP